MTQLALHRMNDLLTLPYRRGAETLPVPLGLDVAGWTTVTNYDFTEYRARYGEDPANPRYIMYLCGAVGADPIDVEVEFRNASAVVTTVELRIPARARKHASFLIPAPEPSDPTWRLTRFRETLVPLPGSGSVNWGIEALLGTIAQLTWVLGREKDDVRWQLADVHAQRHLGGAHHVSLDLIGEDLRVPRFPARSYSFDDTMIALYHFDETPADPAAVIDATGEYRSLNHNGLSAGVVRASTGVFNHGYAFPAADGSSASVDIPTHTTFNIGPNRSFTLDLFFKPSPIVSATPSAIICKGSLVPDGSLSNTGWALSLGSFRGFDLNLRWEIRSGGRWESVYADATLDQDRFYHVAAVIDRDARRLRMYVDGLQVGARDMSAFDGASISNSSPIRIGRSPSGHPFTGVIDEVCMSSAARSGFYPVLGESDDAYRRRLAVFDRWMLPTPEQVLGAVNEQVTVAGDPEPFELVERDRPGARADRLIRILPEVIPDGQRMDCEGHTQIEEADICGEAADDISFNEAYLFRHDDPGAVYGSDENNRKMARATRVAFDSLLKIIASELPPVPGKVTVARSYKPDTDDLHGVGRALRLTHSDLPNEKLAVYALKGGFDYVANKGSYVYASVPGDDMLDIELDYAGGSPQPADGTDLHIGQTVTAKLAPSGLPLAGIIQWAIIRCGYAAGTLAEPVNTESVQFEAGAPGRVTLQVRYTYQQRTVVGYRQIRVGLADLGSGETVTAQGQWGLSEEAALVDADSYFDAQYLVTHAAGLDYGADPNNQKMQVGLAAVLDRLVALLPGPPGQLVVDKAYDPGSSGARAQGRALVLHHQTMPLGELAGLAHAAEFDFVTRTGTSVYCSVAAGELIDIVTSSDGNSMGDAFTVGQPVDIEVAPTSLPTSRDYNWSLDRIGNGNGELRYLLRRQTTFTGTEPGLAAISISYFEPDDDSAFPYTFEIRLKAALDLPSTYIPKHDYDVIMNILNFFHPIGVEVTTANIRKHVVELKGSPINAAPGYTFPEFRDSVKSIVVSNILSRIRSEQDG